MDTGLYFPSTLRDLHDFTRLQDTLRIVAWFTRCCIAADVANPFNLDVNTAYALIRDSTIPTATAFSLADHLDPVVALFDDAAGGEGAFAPSAIHESPPEPRAWMEFGAQDA